MTSNSSSAIFSSVIPVDALIAAAGASAAHEIVSGGFIETMLSFSGLASDTAGNAGAPAEQAASLSDRSPDDVLRDLIGKEVISPFGLASAPAGMEPQRKNLQDNLPLRLTSAPPDVYIVAPISDVMMLSAFGVIPDVALASGKGIAAVAGRILPEKLDARTEDELSYAVPSEKIIYDERTTPLLGHVPYVADSIVDKCHIERTYYGNVTVSHAAKVMRIQMKKMLVEISSALLLPATRGMYSPARESAVDLKWRSLALRQNMQSLLSDTSTKDIDSMIALAEAVTGVQLKDSLNILYKDLKKPVRIAGWRIETMQKAFLLPNSSDPASKRICRATEKLILLSQVGDSWKYAMSMPNCEEQLASAGIILNETVRDQLFAGSTVSFLVDIMAKSREALGVSAMVELLCSGVPLEDIVR